MRVFGIERHPKLHGMALRSHECPQCESLQTDVVPSAQQWLDPVEDNPVSPTFLLSVSEGFDDEIVALVGSAFEAAWAITTGVGWPPYPRTQRGFRARRSC